jgi:dihydroflavonol-4-reductase
MDIGGRLVCVTGASGYVGSHVVRTLLERGCRVRAAVRDASDEARSAHLSAMGDVELVSADLTRGDGIARMLDGCEMLVHAASSVRLTARDPLSQIVEPAMAITRNVIGAAARASLRRVVVTSSVSAVVDDTRPEGYTHAERDWNEHASLERDPYPLSKVRAEREARRLRDALPEDERFELVAVCPSYVQGPALARIHLRSSPSLVRHMLRGKMPAVPRLSLNVVDVRDVAEAHVRALEVDGPAERYLCSNEDIWLRDMGRVLAERFPDHPVPRRELPDVLAYVAALFARQVSVHYLRTNLGRRRSLDNSRVRRELGLSLRPAEESIVETARSIIDNGWL